MPSVIDAKIECIQDVWQENMEEEFKKLRQIVQEYPYIAMDTEFPGIVTQPPGEYRNNPEYHYQSLKCNVDVLKIIQIGMTFMNDAGQCPSPVSTWQFNFKYNLSEERFAKASIDLLQSCGIKFERLCQDGIEANHFAELLMTSGIVLCDNVKWLSFHSGFDFAYLLKILTDSILPDTQDDFLDLLRIFFGHIYDIKYLMKSCKNLKGGLQEVADQLEISRIGPQHQAGSDSLLTGAAFFKMREMFFEDHIDDSKYSGHLFGLTMSGYAPAAIQYEASPGQRGNNAVTNGTARNAGAANTTTNAATVD